MPTNWDNKRKEMLKEYEENQKKQTLKLEKVMKFPIILLIQQSQDGVIQCQLIGIIKDRKC
jgi:hypothetical protein